MVLMVQKWPILPGKVEADGKWTASAIKGTVGAPGVVEFRAYRPATGASQVAITYEFADMAAWAAWYSTEAVQTTLAELHTLAVNVNTELWGPSPVAPAPVRPGQ